MRIRSAMIAITLAGAAGVQAPPALAGARGTAKSDQLAMLNRISWGVNGPSAAAVSAGGIDRWLDEQLAAKGDAPLPPEAQAQIDAMRIVREPTMQLAVELDAQLRAATAITDPAQKDVANKAYKQVVIGLANEAATRSILRDLYSPQQLREQMTWFWFNHFNVLATQRDIRQIVGDYEDQAIRPHALGKFRDLLEATLRHPAMLHYLNNDQNAANRINENYAREIMELHTMGVGSGYTQKDVQELARILTGVGVDLKPDMPRLKPEWQPLYIRAGMFEFNPARHDFGDKQFLGHVIKGSGYAEVEQALDLIARSPATAHHISAQLAGYFMGDSVPPALVNRMAATFRASDGDIASVLRVLFHAPEFKASLGTEFKDPVHYTISALRLAYGDRVILNATPVIGWINRMGEGLYGRETPDGYPLTSAAWTGPGQMATRFDVARQIAYGGATLFKPATPDPVPAVAAPQFQNARYLSDTDPLGLKLSPATGAALSTATSPQEWNALFLSSPDFMRR